MTALTTRKYGHFLLMGLLAFVLTALPDYANGATSRWLKVTSAAYRGEDGAWLGIWLGRVTPSVRKRYHIRSKEGVFVVDVVDDSPADRAGIRKHDVILSFDGEKVRGPEELNDLLEEHKPGERVNVVIARRGVKKTVRVVLGRKPSTPFHKLVPAVPKALLYGSASSWLGVELQELNPDLARYFKLRKPRGALVTSVEPGSPADKAGLKAGDVIVEIDGEEVETPDDVQEILDDLEPGDTVTVTVIRNGRRKTFEVELSEGNWQGRFYITPKGIPQQLQRQLERLQRYNLELGRRFQREQLQEELNRELERLREKELSQEELNRKLERLQEEVKKLQEKIEEMQKEFEKLKRSR